jgi:hypothetical protein
MSKSELRKLNPKLYKKLYGPGSAEARLRALKRFNSGFENLYFIL